MIHRLTIICLIVILVEVLSQGGGSRSSSRSISRSSSNSRGGGGNLSGLTIFFIVSSSFLGACCSLFCCGFLIYAVCSKKDGRKRAANGHSKDFNAKQIRNELIVPINTNDIFESGKWSSRYQHYSRWHGPFQLDIMFDIDQNTLSGGGTDDIGQFSLTGKISTELLTINIRKKYILGTGNAEQNLGHEVDINLQWNNGIHTFVGKWSVHTHKYKGDDQYELVKVRKTITSGEQFSPV
jgi:hypothetical protein